MTSAHVWGGDARKTPGGYQTIVDEGLMDPRHNACMPTSSSRTKCSCWSIRGLRSRPQRPLKSACRGHPMISSVIRAGGKPSIAIDTEIEVSGNMFDIMKGSDKLQAAFDSMEAYDPAARRESKGRPDVDGIVTAQEISCDSNDVLEWANDQQRLRHGSGITDGFAGGGQEG